MSSLASLVETSRRVAATRSRRAKIEELAAYMRSVEPEWVAPAVAYLSGVVPQGALGVGWATMGERSEPADDPTLTVADVAATFDELATTSGPGSKTRRKDLVGGLLGRATEAEQRFLAGLIMGEIRQGALEGLMVDAVAEAAGVPVASVRRATMLNGQIRDVAELALAGGEAALEEIGLTLFRPVKPMLAQSAESLGEALDRVDPAAVEWKLDGVRIQVHRDGNEVEIYTRNLNRVTDRLEEVASVVRSFPAQQLVLDGEAMVFDDDGRPARFQETAGRFGTEEMESRGIQAYFFDLLHIDGRDVIELPLIERRKLLEAVVGESLIPHAAVGSQEEASSILAEALEHRHEGVMVKDLESAYEAGRRGAAWIKVKPVHTLDLVALAAEWGHGRREGWLSNIHLGARGRDGFVMVGKTFKGMTDELLEWQTEHFQQIETRRTRSTVFVRPESVVEIALDGVQISTRYPGGVALRFARVRGYRPDKDPEEADSIDMVRAMAALPPLEA